MEHEGTATKLGQQMFTQNHVIEALTSKQRACRTESVLSVLLSKYNLPLIVQVMVIVSGQYPVVQRSPSL